MGEKYSLNAENREITGRKVKDLRADGKLPAVIYGGKDKPQSITMSAKEFNKIFDEAGSSSIIELIIDGNKTNVIAQEPQYNPVNGEMIHIDLIRVRMDEKIKTEIPLEFIGESPAVADQDGTLVTPHDNIEVECLPGDLVSEIEINIGSLKTFDDQIKVSDITPPSGIQILTDPEEVIALVEAPRSEEELAELDKPTAEEEKEAVEAVAGKEDEEGEESEEGKEESGEESAEPAEKPAEEK